MGICMLSSEDKILTKAGKKIKDFLPLLIKEYPKK